MVNILHEQIKDTSHIIGLDLFEKAQEFNDSELISEAEYAKLRRKIDYNILPILCITYTLQFLDKLSLNYAAAYSFREDLGIDVGQRYSWTAAIFNFGYLFWALPANYIIQKVPVAKFTGSMLFVWAILLVAHIGAKNYGGILVLRFMLGLFELSISPSCMMINLMFYTRQEQPFRMCCFLSCNGISTMVGALLAFGLGHATNAAIKPWKLIFLVIGLLNFVWSIAFLYFCPDSPANARFLTEKEKLIVVDRIARNSMGVKDTQFKPKQGLEALKDVGVILLGFIGLGCGVVNGGSSNFQSALLRGFGFSGLSATALQLPTGAIELVFVFSCGLIAIFRKNMRCILLFISCIPGLAGLIGIRLIPLEHRWSLVGCTWLQYIIGAPVVLSWVLLNANVAGHSKKAISVGIWFVLYATGNIIGAQIFYTREAPRYNSGLIGLITSYAGMMALIIAYRLLMMRRNKLRNSAAGGIYTDEMEQQAIVNGFKDFTDFQNENFRYSL